MFGMSGCGFLGLRGVLNILAGSIGCFGDFRLFRVDGGFGGWNSGLRVRVVEVRIGCDKFWMFGCPVRVF
jgi:hypothetical protein